MSKIKKLNFKKFNTNCVFLRQYFYYRIDSGLRKKERNKFFTDSETSFTQLSLCRTRSSSSDFWFKKTWSRKDIWQVSFQEYTLTTSWNTNENHFDITFEVLAIGRLFLVQTMSCVKKKVYNWQKAASTGRHFKLIIFLFILWSKDRLNWLHWKINWVIITFDTLIGAVKWRHVHNDRV